MTRPAPRRQIPAATHLICLTRRPARHKVDMDVNAILDIVAPQSMVIGAKPRKRPGGTLPAAAKRARKTPTTPRKRKAPATKPKPKTSSGGVTEATAFVAAVALNKGKPWNAGKRKVLTDLYTLLGAGVAIGPALQALAARTPAGK